jgi:anti-sigma regulatory factor (Ser/Thr protein kinase)
LLGVAGLEDVLGATQSASADVILGAISQAVDAHRGQSSMRDDVAALVIKRNGPRPMRSCRSFVLPATLASLRQLEPVVAEVLGPLAERVGLDTWLDETALALAEHLSNIVRHAYGGEGGLISGLIGLQGDRLVIETVDRGANVFDVLRLSGGASPAIPSLDQLPTEGGLGLPLIRAVMDRLHYERHSHGRNSWRLTRRLPDVQ